MDRLIISYAEFFRRRRLDKLELRNKSAEFKLGKKEEEES